MSQSDEPIEGELVKPLPHVDYKYSIGQQCFVLYKNSIVKAEIVEVRILVNRNKKHVEYYFNLLGGRDQMGNPQPEMRLENQIWDTQQSLMASIWSL